MRECRVAIAGFGSVGRAIAALLLSRRARYREVYAIDVRLVAVCGSRSGLFDTVGLEEDRFDDLEVGDSGPDFIASTNAHVLIEAGPSDHRTGAQGLAYLRRALSAGSDAIVNSKGALVCDGRNLRDLARTSRALLKVSGATGAALPTIDLLDYNLKGCRVLQIEGVLNATSNYLLGAMTARGVGLREALREAQAGGFAERDSRDDVEGWDTACKLLILANFGLGADLSMGDVVVDGIQSVTDGQITAWREQGVVPKLLGRLTWDAGELLATVGVRALAADDPLARTTDSNKAIRIRTDVMGEVVVLGCGSEPAATAAAALKDFEHILAARTSRRTPARREEPWSTRLEG